MKTRDFLEKAYRKTGDILFGDNTKRQKKSPENAPEKIYNILLLTNRDSDNVGDQVIEACDIGLISTVMKNLGVPANEYKIMSRAASIVSQKYLETKDPLLLDNAIKTIKKCDIVIFGGAPLFNYLYQNFYERTAVTLEIAQQYGKPVIFSAIGVEGYGEDNAKCQRLKKTLNFDCVKQITTRDGYHWLEQYKENENMLIDKVSDPAVFTERIFDSFKARSKSQNKIGIFVLRGNGFVDNKFDLTREGAAKLWVDTITELEKRGYDYELLTSGHFGDEAFLDYLIRKKGVPAKKCVFNINTPEVLVEKISSYAGIISCRLHPSIISFSLKVPAVGLIWNSKVKHFYESIGYADRLIDVNGINAQGLVDKVESAMKTGVTHNEDYLITVYNTLFNGINKSLEIKKTGAVPYSFKQLSKNLVRYAGTSPAEENEKLKRKFRRTYGKYNEMFDKNIALKNALK